LIDFGDDFTGHLTQPTVSQHWRTILVKQIKGQSHQSQLT